MDLEKLDTLRKDPNFNAYPGIYPMAFVLIGGQIVPIEEYTLNLNNKSDVDTCSIKIPIENIDSSVFTDADENLHEKPQGQIPVAIYAGYFSNLHNTEKYIQEVNPVLQKIANKGTDVRPLSLRFEGYVYQPEWEFGDSGNYLHLECADWTKILREVKLTQNIGGEVKDAKGKVVSLVDPTAGKVLNAVKERLRGITIENPGANLGTLMLVPSRMHPTLKKPMSIYQGANKNLFQALQDVAMVLKTLIIIDGKKIILKKYQQSNVCLWKIKHEEINQYSANLKTKIGFKELRVRYGVKGRPGKSGFVVQIIGTNGKTGKNAKGISAFYPTNAYDGVDLTEIVKINRGTITQQQATAEAKNRYLALAKSLITGNMQIPNANPFWYPDDAILFEGTKNGELDFLYSIPFRVAAINETFNTNGYTQQLEFETDLVLLKANAELEPAVGKPQRLAPTSILRTPSMIPRGM